jgi:NAD(P)-dependent dehydrogenase (short-subunit alcohol dehydrogenase family)
MKPLKDKVAVVTGASRGIVRGIAVVLGEYGVTVYVTGRSRRGSATPDNMPGTIDDTAEEERENWREYGFTDVDGRRPAPFHVQSFEKLLEKM